MDDRTATTNEQATVIKTVTSTHPRLNQNKDALIDSAVNFMTSVTTKKSWKDKLSSRKFWLSAAGCIIGLGGMIGFNDNYMAIIAFAIIEVGSIIGYCIAEGMVDAANFKKLLEVVSQIVDMIQQAEGTEVTTTTIVPPEPDINLDQTTIELPNVSGPDIDNK